ncbi:MAG: hypothetical protein M1818_001586 [Claussenomyces sp. TS43310]|nr:MAG: hypothetical protein M1818_001586 [Claussenomyces sp. TS43310]
MSLLGKKFPAPIGESIGAEKSVILFEDTDKFVIAGPMTPFFVAAAEFKNDPRNPNAKTAKPADKH